MAGFDDFMKSQQTAAPAPVKSGGFDAFMKQTTASGHAPDWTDDVKASAKFLGNEVSGVAQALNPWNMATGMYNAVAHPIETGKALINTPGRMIEQYQNGDMDGLAQGIGNIAGSVIAGKVAPEVPGMAQKAAQGLGNAVDATTAGAKALASNGAIQAAAPVIAKMAAKTLVKGVLGAKAGPLGVIAYDMLEDAVKSKLEANAAKAAPKPVTTNATIPTKVTPTSSTNVVSAAQSAGKGARTLDAMNLDAETTQALLDAHKAGEVAALPAEAKTELVQAVKAGDSATVSDILDGHTATKGVFKAVEDKVNVLAKYIQDHNIDASQITTASDRQTIADAAYAHGVKNSMSVPKSGRYRGISDDTWKLVQGKLGGK